MDIELQPTISKTVKVQSLIKGKKKKSYKFKRYSEASSPSSSSSSSSSRSSSASPSRLPSRLWQKREKPATTSITSNLNDDVMNEKEMNYDPSLTEMASTSTSAPEQCNYGEKLSEIKKKKKYDIWSSLIQVDTLMEDMRGINVTRNIGNRSVETYDYQLPSRLARESDGMTGCKSFDKQQDVEDDVFDSNGFLDELKECKKLMNRKRAYDNEQMNGIDDVQMPPAKYSRLFPEKENRNKKVSSKKIRKQREKKCGVGNQNHGGKNDIGSQKSGSDSDSRRCRYIKDMSDVSNRTIADIASEMSSKLYEKKIDLIGMCGKL